MIPAAVKLSVYWFGLMLTYLLGDVLRVYEKGQDAAMIDGKRMDENMLLAATGLMVVPIIMGLLNISIEKPFMRWVNIVVSLILLVVNIFGIKTYSGLYDRILIGAGLLINLLIVWFAWKGN